VPLGGADDEAQPGHETLGSTARAGAWSEERSAQLLEPPGRNSFHVAAARAVLLRRGVRVSVWAAGGAVLAAAALALTAGPGPSRVPSSPRTTAATPKAPLTTQAVTAPVRSRAVSHSAARPTLHTQRRRHTRPTTTHHIQSEPSNQPSVVATSDTIGARTSSTATRGGPTASTTYTPSASRPTTPQQQVATERTSAAGNTNASAAQTSAAHRPAFGANGLLGPGSSPTS